MRRRKDILLFFLTAFLFAVAPLTSAITSDAIQRLEVLLDDLAYVVGNLEADVNTARQNSEWDLAEYDRIAVDAGDVPLLELREMLEENGFVIVAKHPVLPNVYAAQRSWRHNGREKRGTQKVNIPWLEPLPSIRRQKRNALPVMDAANVTVNDPLFAQQSVQLARMGVLTAWQQGFSGKGVIVAIVDDGIVFDSPDLLEASRQEVSLPSLGAERLPSLENFVHGTLCASVVAMQHNNSECGAGAASRATILDVPLLAAPVTDFSESAALSQPAHIFSCSWGPPDDGRSVDGPGGLASKALRIAAEQGRHGLGSIFVWASGNGGLHGDDCGLDGFVSNPDVIAVGWARSDGGKPAHSEACSNIMTSVIAHGGEGQVSVSATGSCSSTFTGSSAAAPLAAAALALLLEAHPQLPSRAIFHLVVHSSNPSPLAREGVVWTKNAAGHEFSREFGFGEFSVSKAISLGSNVVSPIPAVHKCERVFKIDKNQHGFGTFSARLLLENCHKPSSEEEPKTLFAEHIQLSVSLSHPVRGNVAIDLISPKGTKSQLLRPRPLDRSADGLEWTFTSVHFWDEDPRGDWTVHIYDVENPEQEFGHVQTLGLTAHFTNRPTIETAHSDSAASPNSASYPAFLLPALCIVLSALVVYGAFEFMLLRKKINRTESSLRILSEE